MITMDEIDARRALVTKARNVVKICLAHRHLSTATAQLRTAVTSFFPRRSTG